MKCLVLLVQQRVRNLRQLRMPCHRSGSRGQRCRHSTDEMRKLACEVRLSLQNMTESAPFVFKLLRCTTSHSLVTCSENCHVANTAAIGFQIELPSYPESPALSCTMVSLYTKKNECTSSPEQQPQSISLSSVTPPSSAATGRP